MKVRAKAPLYAHTHTHGVVHKCARLESCCASALRCALLGGGRLSFCFFCFFADWEGIGGPCL